LSDWLEKIEKDFWEGKVSELKDCLCQKCGGRLVFSVYKAEEIQNTFLGWKFKCSVSIYCYGKCGIMLSHIDGYLPKWAESVGSWDEFNNNLCSDEIKSKFPLNQPELINANVVETALCPFCKNLLRSANAKQCRFCRRDWHDPEKITVLGE